MKLPLTFQYLGKWKYREACTTGEEMWCDLCSWFIQSIWGWNYLCLVSSCKCKYCGALEKLSFCQVLKATHRVMVSINNYYSLLLISNYNPLQFFGQASALD